VKQQFTKGAEGLLQTVEIVHVVEENKDDGLGKFPARWREVYWELGSNRDTYLAVRPLYEWPNVTPRWELLGSDAYGTSPAMDALPEVVQLQIMYLERAKALEKMVSPPLIVDQQLRNKPKALGANGITYAATASQNFGAKAAYNVAVQLQDIANDIQNLQTSIRETLYNPLFNMISQLDTVRSATEIDARREEKLVHLGPVLERFYNEGLDPVLKRIYGIMLRADLLPAAPQELDDTEIEVNYVSVLTDAQRASGTITIERFFQFTGGLAGVYPEATQVANVEELIRQYAEGIGVKPTGVRSRQEVAEAREAANAQQSLAAAAATGKDLAQGAKVLSETDVGAGMNAMQALL
jgi:hypothetical protein